MNRERRKRIADVQEKIAGLLEELDEIRTEEEEAYDNLPESLQESERGAAMEEAIGTLDEAYDDLENVSGTLEELLN